jgi:hypothetical protein
LADIHVIDDFAQKHSLDHCSHILNFKVHWISSTLTIENFTCYNFESSCSQSMVCKSVQVGCGGDRESKYIMPAVATCFDPIYC